MTTKNKYKLTYKIEASRGYIPSDKVMHQGHQFETAFSEYFKKTREFYKENKTHIRNKNLYKEVINYLSDELDAFMSTPYQDTTFGETVKDKNIPMFYFNINNDGIDVFCHRNNWK